MADAPKKASAKQRAKPGAAKAAKRAAAPPAKGVQAKFPGTCPGCQKGYKAGAKIDQLMGGWGHPACAAAWREAEKVRSGATYRSQKPSTWRIGAGPGSTRQPY